MKIKIIIIVFSVFLYGCNKAKKEIPPNSKIENISNKNQCLPQLKENIKLEKEKVIIYSEENNESLSYSKNDINKIEILFPVLKEKNVRNPEEAYWFGGVWKEYINEKGEKETFSFGSETGQDDFYLVYAYYLKKLNGDEQYRTERETLIELYQTINGIYESLNYGGTFYGHQYKRLIGEAEYSIYLLSNNKDYYQKNYDFKKQKVNYLKSLIQYIEDEEGRNIENEIEAKRRAEKLEKKIDVIQRLATNYFYLNQVQKFEMDNYK